MWRCYESLNRLTADELVTTISENGFELLKQYRTSDEEEPPSKLTAIFQPDVLRNNQVVALFRRSQ
jgi:hypothetical protein